MIGRFGGWCGGAGDGSRVHGGGGRLWWVSGGCRGHSVNMHLCGCFIV